MDFLFLDLETTGLDPQINRIIEVACVLTKEDFEPYLGYESLVYQNPHVGWSGIAREMHEKTGLLGKLWGAPDERKVIDGLLTFLRNNLELRNANLAGNSVHFDRSFLAAQWPEVLKHLTHRHLDVSSLRLVGEATGRDKFVGSGTKHRAMDDVKNSLAELKYWRSP